ncbi:MAG: GGDEF domain-containing protein [Candidatus Acidiferrales bacterium]
MPIPELQAEKGSQATRLTAGLAKQIFNRKIIAMGRKNGPPENGLTESLSSALRAADSEFGQILQEVDEISKLLKSDHPDTQTMKVATHPAVWGAVKQALLDRELRYLALTDDLTCLFNRRGFFAAATQQLKLAQRNGQNLLLLFCDVDHLKKINDSYGHREGDLALIHAADALEQTFRDSDILARLGGDEFVVLATEASVQTSEVLLHRLEKALKKSHSGESRYQLSLSVGVARFDPKRAVALGELMAQADEAMYQQKRNHQESFNGNN